MDAIDNAIKILENGEKVERSITLDTLEVTKDNAADVYKQFGGK
jgi:ribose transport system substrate-binding protein